MDERDILVFTDEDGQEIQMEILDYFEFEDQLYAMLIEAEEDEHDHGREHGGELRQGVQLMQEPPRGCRSRSRVGVEGRMPRIAHAPCSPRRPRSSAGRMRYSSGRRSPASSNSDASANSSTVRPAARMRPSASTTVCVA